MALVTGTDYDHIDITAGSTTTRHMVKDTSAREDIATLQENFNKDFRDQADSGNYAYHYETALGSAIGNLPAAGGTRAIPYTGYFDGTSKTTNGITFTVQKDGSFIVNGTATGTAVFWMYDEMQLPFNVQTVTLSKVSEQFIGLECYYDSQGTEERQTLGNSSAVKSITFDTLAKTDYTKFRMRLYANAGQTFRNCHVYPLLELGDTSHNILYRATNKNLFRIGMMDVDGTRNLSSGTINGVTFALNNGELTLSGICTKGFYIQFENYNFQDCPFTIGDVVKLTGSDVSAQGYARFYCTTKDSSNATLQSIYDHYGSATLITKEFYSVSTGIRVWEGANFGSGVTYTPQIEIGTQSTGFVQNETHYYNPMFSTEQIDSFEGNTTIYSTPKTIFAPTVRLSTQKYLSRELKSNPVKLRICSYNTGVWNYGDRTNPGYQGGDVADKVTALKHFLAENQFDILCCQEFRPMLDANDTVSAKTEIITPLFNNGMKGYGSMGEFTFSQIPFENAIKWKTGTGTKSSIIAMQFSQNEKEIILVNAHLTWNDAEARTEQAEWIYDFVKDYPYVIICGDMNTHDPSELDVFRNAGYKFANGGYFGEFVTTKETGGKYDNIIVSPNISIINVVEHDADDLLPSDHRPISADLIVNATTYEEIDGSVEDE